MHIAVLKKEVMEFLAPKPNENFIDCTINGGGHAMEILERIKPEGKILGIDSDQEIVVKLGTGEGQGRDCPLIVVCGNFADLKKIIEKYDFGPINGILLDLGMSSWHLEKSGRGFSFLRDEPLDMRYDKKNQKSNRNKFRLRASKYQKDESELKKDNNLTAEYIINNYSREEIEEILEEYGEEKFARRITQAIVGQRKIKPIKKTFQLVEIIKRAVPNSYERGRIHPATRTFQALRIAVNKELDSLKKVLPQASESLTPGGRLAIISFHSLEDRIIKNYFRTLDSSQFKILTKKPIRPGSEELKDNPRSRSAKLRAILKIKN